MADPIYRVASNGNGTLIAVGANGLILRSGDGGITWATIGAGTTNHLYGVVYGIAFGIPRWVIVGQNGTVLTSLTGEAWVIQPIFTALDLYDVAFGGVFLAIGQNGTLATSDDFGVSWSLKPSGTSEDLFSIDVDLGRYIIVGDNDTVITGFVSSLEDEVIITETVGMADSNATNTVQGLEAVENFETIEGYSVDTTAPTIESPTTLNGTQVTDLTSATGSFHHEITEALSTTDYYPIGEGGTQIGVAVHDVTVTENVATTAPLSQIGSYQHEIAETINHLDEAVWELYSHVGEFNDYLTETVIPFDTLPTPNGVYNAAVVEDVAAFSPLHSNATYNLNLTAEIATLSTVLTGDVGNVFSTRVGRLEFPYTIQGEILIGTAIAGQLTFPHFTLRAPNGYAWTRQLSGRLVFPHFTVAGGFLRPIVPTGRIIFPHFDIRGRIIFGAEAFLGDSDTVVWVVNSETKMHSTYKNWAANSHGVFNGVELVAMADGIYELGASDGDETDTAYDPIVGKVYWAPSDMGTDKQKRIDAAYVRLRRSGELLRLVAITDEATRREYTEDVRGFPLLTHPKRVLFTRGLQGRIWQIGFENIDGGDFSLEDIEIIPIILSRRLR